MLDLSLPAPSSFDSLKTKPRTFQAPFSLRQAEKLAVQPSDTLRHASLRLDARHYKSVQFLSQLLTCLRELKIPYWSNPDITSDRINVHKVSGSLTNAVFFVSSPSVPEVPTVLLRIYGPSSGDLISRPRELHTLHVLSSQYNIGPRIYGTFDNGRVEEYFESTTLTPADIRDSRTSRCIAARMADFHSVHLAAVEDVPRQANNPWDIGVTRNVAAWLGPAQAILSLPSVPESTKSELDLKRFRKEWDKYLHWLSRVDDVNSGSRRVFAHNDAQYGNLLRLKHVKEDLEEHHQIIVVDFEYAAANPASYDIANHFHEWTADYHSPTPHLLDVSKYPTREQRHNFYAAYLDCNYTTTITPTLLDKLDKQVRYWSPASHAMWAIWGVIQAREDVEGGVKHPEF
ncbi:hypothetical protein AMATHDRAFT_63568, partial [Amanita thiersii Skay4041]